MSNTEKRWKMNRLGFVNFWLYDNETFDLADGKLLLRGQNGSGKSITTQSFIPFILDGDRTPSRLDPFGSNDRKMDYYFLGDNEKDDVTGYLFLEFRKEQTDEYRTIGIGQRAQRGKPGLAFWGFILKDGRRIGIDLNLFRETGGVRIPLNKRECRELIEENNGNLFLESQNEYKKAVNQSLFGFPTIEQYDQFVRLLIKVRAPKLSKEFKPSKIYDILNDSLQPLSDEDLYSMVDAMEKMDEIEDRLQQLKTTHKELHYIIEEYNRYNEYIGGKKATAWLEADFNWKKSVKESDSLSKELHDNEVQQKQSETELAQLNEQILLAQDKISAYQSSGIEDQIRKREEFRTELIEKKAEKEEFENSIFTLREKLVIQNRDLKTATENLEICQKKVTTILQELDALNAEVSFRNHEKLKQSALANTLHETYSMIHRELEQLKQKVSELVQQLNTLDQKRRTYSEKQQEVETLQQELRKSEHDLEQAQDAEDTARETLIESWYQIRTDSLEFYFTEQERNEISDLLSSYTGSSDYASLLDWQNRIQYRSERQLNTLLLKETTIHEDLIQQEAQLQEELESLLLETEEIPERSTAIQRSRDFLHEHGIQAVPLYEAIEFQSGVSVEEAVLLEEQLRLSGLLDALLVTEEDRAEAERLLKEHTDILIQSSPSVSSPITCFTPASEALSEGLLKATDRFLSSISQSDQGTLVLRSDGYFRNGLLEGFVHETEYSEVRFIGAAARRENHRRKIEEKEAQLQSASKERSFSEELLALLSSHIAILHNEADQLPSIEPLNQTIAAREDAERVISALQHSIEEKTRSLNILYQEVLRFDQEIRSEMSALPYPQTPEGYENALDQISSYILEADSLYHSVLEVHYQNEQTSNLKIRMEDYEEQLDDKEQSKAKTIREIDRIDGQIQTIDQILNAPEHKQMAKEIESVRKQLNESMLRRDEVNTTAITLKATIASQLKQLEVLQKETASLFSTATLLQSYFLEEVQLGLLPYQEGLNPEDVNHLAVIAEGFRKGIREADRSSDITEILSRLFKTYQAHIGGISNTVISIDDCFEPGEQNAIRSRRLITAIYNSQKVSIQEFRSMVEKSISETELLIQAKDRELFENILSDTLGSKMFVRIDDSKEWVSDMSDLMKQMDSSMGLSFSLRWVPKASESSDQLSANELEQILGRDKDLLSEEDKQKVSEHFRSEIRVLKQQAIENNLPINYQQMVRDALDYRKWFEFRMYFTRTNEKTKELTDHAFNTFSGGEKAMAMYIPLFAAVNAQYLKSRRDDHPRIIALDEAFAGVDDKNISSMFRLVEDLDFDYIMNSQSLWGCYESVHSLRIAELLRPENAKFITVIFYYWNGKVRMLDEH